MLEMLQIDKNSMTIPYQVENITCSVTFEVNQYQFYCYLLRDIPTMNFVVFSLLDEESLRQGKKR